MFDDIPVRVWLLIAVAAIAWAPALYVWRHMAAAPNRRDITQAPPDDLGWRSEKALARSLLILALLAAFVIFIFTPWAEQLARSPRLPPMLLGGIGAWVLFECSQAAVTGSVSPLIRGFNLTYSREGEPKRFWASLSWNAVLGAGCLWLALQLNAEASTREQEEACFADQQLAEIKAPCGRMVELYTEQIQADPRDMTARYNRGLAYQRLGNDRAAIADFTEVLGASPDDLDALIQRGIALLDQRRLDEAEADFTRAHELSPKDPWPLANRGITYAWKKDGARARADFAAAVQIDPANAVVLRGEALLALEEGNGTLALHKLNESLKQDPYNRFALTLREQVAAGEALAKKQRDRVAEDLRSIAEADAKRTPASEGTGRYATAP